MIDLVRKSETKRSFVKPRYRQDGVDWTYLVEVRDHCQDFYEHINDISVQCNVRNDLSTPSLSRRNLLLRVGWLVIS